jgi:hypothetical protein
MELLNEVEHGRIRGCGLEVCHDISTGIFISRTCAQNAGIGIGRQMTIETSRRDEVGSEGMELSMCSMDDMRIT